MGNYFDYAKQQSTLYQAWRRIRENGHASHSEETRSAIESFERSTNRNISRIQKRLRENKFQFEPQTGVLMTKSSGGYRGIVMASVENRIVERALLDTLQTKSEFVKRIVSHETSVGGVPDRSVPHGLKLVRDAMAAGNKYFVRSDISGFFDSIARETVIDRIALHVPDEKFIDILTSATTVTLANENSLGENRKIFPLGDDGVAQGSPLSPLFGNILLYDFDLKFNADGVICVRFIDDFVLLAKEERRVSKAFQSAKRYLSGLNLVCHDPFVENANKEKAQQGNIEDGFVFLGYDIHPGIQQPSAKARLSLESTIDDRIRSSMKHIESSDIGVDRSYDSRRYAQTLSSIDRIIKGWGNAFAYGNAPTTIEQLDLKIDAKLDGFRRWYADWIRGQDWKTRRRTGGVSLLSDIKPKHLDDVPFRVGKGMRFVQSKKTLTISTDGSVITGGKRLGRDRGPGGWAFVVHETGQRVGGQMFDVTNNQMELTAVIEAIRSSLPTYSLRIRTDSRYVSDTANSGHMVKSNADLWKVYRDLSRTRRIKIEWVKAHHGDVHNERADKLAKEQSQIAFKNMQSNNQRRAA